MKMYWSIYVIKETHEPGTDQEKLMEALKTKDIENAQVLA